MDGPDRAQPQPRSTLSRSRIARTGVELADAEGLAAVSMRKVAERLGAGTMSLYRHVTSRDELIALMIDEVYAGVSRTVGTNDWRQDLSHAAHQIRATTIAHPWLAGRSVPRLGLGPSLLGMLESTLALVDGYGLTVDDRLDVLGTIQAFVQGYVLEEIAERGAHRATGLTKSGVQQRQESRVREIAASGRYPQFVRVVTEAEDDPDVDRVFERRLHYVLDGLAPIFR